MCIVYVKGRERGTECVRVCRLCEEKREGYSGGCVGYLKGREKETESMCVSVRYVKGRERGSGCVCTLCERKRERDRVFWVSV